MHTFSQLLFQLYRLTRECPPPELQEQLLALIKPVISFDAAAWPTGAYVSGEVLPHTVYLQGFSDSFLQTWEKYKHQDHLIQRVMLNPGVTFNVCVQSEFAGSEILENHCKPNRMEQILCTSELDSFTGLYNVIAIYRSGPQAYFTEDERLFMQELVPHLVEAWKTNRIEYLKRSLNRISSTQRHSAIADQKGILHVTDHKFASMMLMEWPEWRGALLPREIRDLLRAQNEKFCGDRITIHTQPFDNFVLLNIRPRSDLDSLSQREEDVAVRFAEGKSYKQIAKELDIAPATVRTHLNTIYHKLRINNKVRLAELLR